MGVLRQRAVGILAIAGTLMWIDESCDENARAGFDPFGFLLVTLGLSSFVFGLIEGYTYGWTAPSQPFELFGWRWPLDSVSIIPFAFAVGLVSAWCVRRRGDPARARRQVLPVRLRPVALPGLPVRQPRRHDRLARRVRSAVRLPLFLQAVLGLSAFQVGLTCPVAGRRRVLRGADAAGAANRYGPRRVVTLGMGLEAIGIFARRFSCRATSTSCCWFRRSSSTGSGVGFATAQLTSIVLSDVPTEVSGLASGTNSMLRQIGSALGIAILGSALFVSLGVGTGDRLAKIPGMPPAAQVAVRRRSKDRPGRR
jgi:hypothetical protein